MPPKFENMQNWAPEGTYTVYKYDNQIIRVLRPYNNNVFSLLVGELSGFGWNPSV